MESKGGPERAGSLVVELAARTVIVDGKRVELPPTEFSLLAVLAARPGEVVTHKELLKEAFGDSAYMDIPDLHWRIWKIRSLIGDTEKTIIRNRRGVGTVLEAQRVEVLEGVAEHPVEAPPLVVRLEGDEPESQAAVQDAALEEATSEPQRARRFVLNPVALVILGLIAALVLGGSWLAGYTLSQRTEAPTTADAPPRSAKPEPDNNQRPQGQKKKDNRKRPEGQKKTPGRSGDGSSFAVGPSENVVTGDTASSNQPSAPSGDSRDPEPKSEGATNDQPPPPPQPNAQLYHLYNADSGDHIMTTSSSVANQKQAEGYESDLEGGVFTAQEKGTVAIALDSGTAYVYRDSSSAPDAVTVTALYKLSSGDDFFYTTSSSAANQAQSQGWSRTTAGYVAS
ncbi:MAG: winged helix-turn-helix domain-containing protein [Actinobacteria bacterium]|nr:winged helix-turn-helix domain-containing protein [Actinomycetota bacterium]